MTTFRIFFEGTLDEYLRAIVANACRTIQNEAPDYLVNVNEAEYLEHLTVENTIAALQIDFDHAEISAEERMVDARDPFHWHDTGTKYRKQVVTYHLPFSGNPSLLQYRPNPALAWSTEVYINAGYVCFEIVDYANSAEQIKVAADGIISKIRQQQEHMLKQVEVFNRDLPAAIKEAFDKRKKELLEKREVLTSLGVPIRKSKNMPATFAVPTVRKKVFAKPMPSQTVGAAVPTLNPTVYQEILKTIFDMGKVFERLPSTYAGKDEPTLRDHLILQLEPRFEGSTTGETFNKAGKTDILIRHEKSNIFVAECKFWDGKVAHHKTIDQLLSYLSWRDSKTAIVYFVSRKEVVPILQEIARSTAEHPCHVRDLEKKENGSWQAYEFHLPGDKNCKIELTILAFHIPPAG